MRAFVGIPIPEKLKPKIVKIQERFSRFDIKLVEPENLHFNLKFIKEIGEDKIEVLKKEIEKVVSIFEPFSLKVASFGVFPNEKYLRVIWLGVKDGKETLIALAKEVNNSLEKFGLRKEAKFVPHLTLGRVRSGKNKEEILRIIEELKDVDIGEMRVEKVVLFKSTLTSKGPIYEEIFSVNLGSKEKC